MAEPCFQHEVRGGNLLDGRRCPAGSAMGQEAPLDFRC